MTSVFDGMEEYINAGGDGDDGNEIAVWLIIIVVLLTYFIKF